MSEKVNTIDRRKFLKLAALTAGSTAFAGKLPTALAQQQNEPDSPIYLALNMSKVANNEESFGLMKKVGPKVCITTATHPGFVGFQANIQTGILPLAGRYGGGKVPSVAHVRIRDLAPVKD